MDDLASKNILACAVRRFGRPREATKGNEAKAAPSLRADGRKLVPAVDISHRIAIYFLTKMLTLESPASSSTILFAIILAGSLSPTLL